MPSKPKKPTRNKLPDRPRQSAPLSQWRTYLKKTREWVVKEGKKETEYNKKLTAYKSGKSPARIGKPKSTNKKHSSSSKSRYKCKC